MAHSGTLNSLEPSLALLSVRQWKCSLQSNVLKDYFEALSTIQIESWSCKMDYFIMIPILVKQILCYPISSGFQETKIEAFEKRGSCQFPSASFYFYFCHQFELGLKHSCCIINIVYNRFTRRNLECNILTMH